MEMYVEGVSTRKVKEVTEELCGTSFSKSLVSSLAGSLDSELEAWRDRRLEVRAYPYVFVDARYEKVRVDHKVVNRGVLVVSGVRDDGFREVLGVGVADTESEATYQELFRSLKRRGLSGVQLVVSEDHEGLKSAIARHFQGASHQRCQVHTSARNPWAGAPRLSNSLSSKRCTSPKRGGAPGEVRFRKPSTPPSSLARFIHWLTAPSLRPKARAICLWFQPCCLSSKALRRGPSRQSVAWLDNVFSIELIIHSFRSFRRDQ